MTLLQTRLDEGHSPALTELATRLIERLGDGALAAAGADLTHDATVFGKEAARALDLLCALVQRDGLVPEALALLPTADVDALNPERRAELFGGAAGRGERVGFLHLTPSGGRGRVSLGLLFAAPARRWQVKAIFDPSCFTQWARAAGAATVAGR